MLKHWRHGDIMIAEIDSLPSEVRERPGNTVLAWGEVTGHSHRIEDPGTARFYTAGRAGGADENGYFAVTASCARLVHEEHGTITLPRGAYRFWHQREYTPGAIRRVVD